MTARTAIALPIVFLLSLPAAQAQISGLETEQKLARMALRQAWEQCPQDLDADRQSAVRRVGNRVLAAWPAPLKGYDYRFYVDGCETPNAWAVPTGHVSVSRGLLDAMESEDELAAVLAHEIAHVEYRHGYRKWRNHRNRSLIGAALFGIASATDNPYDDLAAITLNVVSQLNLFAHSRDREREADLVASLYLHRAGLGDAPLRQAFDRLGGGGSGLLSTHPHMAERIARTRDTQTRPFAETEVFHGLDRRGERVATLRFDLQRQYGRELDVVATLTATRALGRSDNVNTLNLRAGGRRVVLKEKTAEKIHPGGRVSPVFGAEGRGFLTGPIEGVDLKLRNVDRWARAYTAAGEPAEAAFDGVAFEGLDGEGVRVATLRFLSQHLFEKDLHVTVDIRATGALRRSDRVRDMTVVAGGRTQRLSERSSERISPGRTTRVLYRLKDAEAFLEEPREIAELRLRNVERWRRTDAEAAQP